MFILYRPHFCFLKNVDSTNMNSKNLDGTKLEKSGRYKSAYFKSIKIWNLIFFIAKIYSL